MRVAAAAGVVLYLMMWTVVLPPATNPVIDDHILGAVTLVALALLNAGDTWGLGRRLARHRARRQGARPALTPTSSAPDATTRPAPGGRTTASRSRRGAQRQRDPPQERGAARAARAHLEGAARGRARVGARCAARSRAARRASPVPSSSDAQPELVVAHLDLDLGVVGERVAGEVGERLTQHRQQVHADRGGHRGVDAVRWCGRRG